MTISQVIQTISLGNFTYFTVSHAYFSQISSTAATMPPCFGNNVMFCRGRIGMGRIGQELHWPRIVLVMDCIGMGRTGSGCIALDHFVPRKRFKRDKTLCAPHFVPDKSFSRNKTSAYARIRFVSRHRPNQGPPPKTKKRVRRNKSLTRY